MKVLIFKKKTFVFYLTVFALVVIIGVFCLSGAIIKNANAKKRSLPIYCVQTEEKKVAISFDCAWGVDSTNELLRVMEEKNIVSTFFMVEFWSKKFPEYVKLIDEKGHCIGTHSSTHSYMSKMEKDLIIKELKSSSEAIEKVTGKEVKLFRAPYGDYNDRLIDTANEMGIYTIQWDVDSLDWKGITAEEIYKRVTSKVKNGSIILCHNNGLHTAEALPLIIDKLQHDGYSFTTIYDLIYKDNYRIDANGTQIKEKIN